MPLHRVIRGQVAQTEAYFEDTNGEALIGTGPATWSIFDYLGAYVMGGTGTQDMSDPRAWTTNVNIPLSAAISFLGKKYRMAWVLPTTKGRFTATEMFEVVPEGDPISPVNKTDVLMLAGGVFSDHLAVPSRPLPGTLKLQVFNMQGAVVYQAGAIDTSNPSRQVNDTYYYDHQSNEEQARMISGYDNDGFSPYIAQWSYTLPTEGPSTEFHAVYVITPKIASFMNSLKKDIDRVNLGDIHPMLAWTDIDLAHYLLRGLDYLNSMPPQVTGFTLHSVPMQFVDPMLKAGAIAALRAQYAAEGMLTFDMQGLGVQLNTERTQYLQGLHDMLKADLDGNLKSQKRLWARSGAGTGLVAHLGLSLNPNTTFGALVRPGQVANYLRFMTGAGLFGSKWAA